MAISKLTDGQAPNEKDKAAFAPDNLNPPLLDEESGKTTQKAVSSAKQAWQICKRLELTAKRARIPRHAQITDRYNGAQPFDPGQLRASGQSWRNNFSTHPLGSIIDRIKPAFNDAIHNSKFLTLAKLPDDYDDAARKSECFRKRLTTTLRSWDGWDNLVNQITQENVLTGYATPARLDDHWHIRMFRPDEIFFPEGTGQQEDKVQYFCIRQQLLVHEFLELFQDQSDKVLEMAGVNKENCIKIVNEQFTTPNKPGKTEMDMVDKRREGSIWFSYQDESKTIDLYHLMVREYDGTICLWTTDVKEGNEVKYKEGIHEDMPDATTLFTLQTGNTHLYGSYGYGRYLVNITTAIDRGRCVDADQKFLSGMLIIQSDEADFNEIQPTVRHPFIILPTSAQVVTQTLTFSPEAAASADARLVDIAQDIVGSLIPDTTDQEGVSPTSKVKDVDDANRENAVKQGVLNRWYRQFAKLIEGFQHKIFSPLNLREGLRVWEDRQKKKQAGIVIVAQKVIDWLGELLSKNKRNAKIQAGYESAIADRDAIECICGLLDDGLSIDEIALVALSPATETVAQENEANNTATVQWLTVAVQTPFVDRKKALELGAEVTGVSQDRVDRVMLPDVVDPTITAENTEKQIVEYMMAVAGEDISQLVSERDNHEIHIKVLAGKMGPLMQAFEAKTGITPQTLQLSKNLMAHLTAHANADTGPDAQNKPDIKSAIATWTSVIKFAEGHLQQVMDAQAKLGAPPTGQVPLPPNGTPLLANGNAPQTPDGNQPLDHLQAGGDLVLRATEQQRKQQELEMQQQQAQHQQEMDVLQKKLDAAKLALEAQKQAELAMQHQEQRQDAANKPEPKKSATHD